MYGWIQSGFSNTAFSNVNSNDLIIRTNNIGDKIVVGSGKDPTKNATMYLTSNAVGITKLPAPGAIFDVGGVFTVGVDSNVTVSTSLSVESLTTAALNNASITSCNIISSNITSSTISSQTINASNITSACNVVVGYKLLPFSNLSATLGDANNRFQDLWIGGNSFHIGDVTMSQGSNGDLKVATNDGTSLKNMIASGFQIGDSNAITMTQSNGTILFYENLTQNPVQILHNIWSVNSNIGIGTSNPSKLLDVAGDAKIEGDLYLQSGKALNEAGTKLFINPDSNYKDVIVRGDTMSVQRYLGIGTSNPQYELDVPGIARLNNVLLSHNQLPFLVYNDYVDNQQNIPWYGVAVPSDSNLYLTGKNGIVLLTSNAPIVIDNRVSGVGIRTSNVNGMLQFAEGDTTRKIVLSETSNNDYQVTSIGTMASNMVFQVPGSNAQFKFFAATNDSSSADVLTVQGDGNVKIGSTETAQAVQKLEVDGSVKLSGKILVGDTTDTVTAGRILSAGNSLLQAGDKMSLGFGKDNSTRNQAEITYKHIGDNSMSNVLTLGHANVDVLSVTGYGGVGIGTDNPLYDLDVRGTIFAENDVICESNLKVGGTITTHSIETSASNATLTIGSSSNTTTINIGGSNTTINIGGPGDTINIQGDVTYVETTNAAITDASLVLNKGGSNAVGCGIEIEENSQIKGYIKVSSNNNGFVLKAPQSSNVVSLNIGSNLEINNTLFMSYSNKFVGVGTASIPQHNMHIQSSESPSFVVESLSNDVVTIGLENSNLSWLWRGPIYESNEALQLSLYDKSAEAGSNAYITITSDGLVGLGNDAPQYALDVTGTINANAVLVNGQPLTAGAGGVGGGTGAGWAAAGSNIYSDSNIGIKKTNPFYDLDVNGSVNATQYLLDGSPLSAGYWSTSNDVMYSLSNVGIGIATPQYALDVGGTINATSILVNGTNISSGFWQLNAGNIYSMCNVGVGTSAPGKKLDIVGDARVVGNFEASGTASLGALSVTSNASVSGQLSVSKKLNLESKTWGDGICFNGGNNRLYADDGSSTVILNIDGSSNFQITNTSGSSLLSVSASNGNVGISDSNPAYTLSVGGSLSASSYCNLTWNMVNSKPTFATVATSGDYQNLVNKPGLCNVATTGQYSDLIDKPNLASVATSGSYNDLISKPALATVATTGKYTDLSSAPALCNIAVSGAWDDLSGLPSGLSLVASNDLSNFPNTVVFQQKVGVGVESPAYTLDVQGAINATSYCNVNWSSIVNKPTLCNVATTGDFHDLTNAPGLSFFPNDISTFSCNVGIKVTNPQYALEVSGAVSATSYCNLDWSMVKNTPSYSRPTWNMLQDAPSNLSFFVNDLSNFGAITATSYCNLNWSMVEDTPSFCNIATSGDWADINGAPTNLSEFTNDLSFFSCNVGIGTATPNSTLQVAGSIYADTYCNLSWSMVKSKPTFATVATSGLYDDLTGAPSSLSSFENDLSNFSASNVQFAGKVGINKSPDYALDISGAISASGYCNLDWSMIANRPTFNGDYNTLSNLPTYADVATSGLYADLQGTPSLCNVATSGSYADLADKPSLSLLAYQGSNSFCNLTDVPTFATVATTGAYSDLSDIPMYLSSFSNDINTFDSLSTAGDITTSCNLVVQGAITTSNNMVVDGSVTVTQILKVNTITSLDTESNIDIGCTSNIQTLNLGVCNGVSHVINIGNGVAGVGTCNVINIGSAHDTVIIPGTFTKNYIGELYTSNHTFTLNSGGISAAGAGILIEENGSNNSYWVVSNDRNSILMRTPNSTSDTTFDMSGTKLSINGTLSVLSSTSNVGIGTSSPTDKLQVQGGNLRIHNSSITTPASNSIFMSHVNSTTMAKIDSYYSSNLVALRFFTGSNTSTIQTMTLLNGSVGVGSSSPQSRLHVTGTGSTGIGSTIAEFRNSADAQRLSIVDETTYGTKPTGILSTTGYGLGMYSRGGGHIYYTGGGDTERMRISSSGYVGIGDSNPYCKLSVKDTVVGTNLASFSTSITTGTQQNIAAFSSYSTAATGITLTNYTTASPILSWILQASGASNVPGSFNIVNGTAYRFNIDSNGNVGIGTKTPTNNLEVVGGITSSTITTSNVSASNIVAMSNLLLSVQQQVVDTSNRAFSMSGKWSSNGNNTYYTLGKVGIATSNPSYELDVNGTVNATTYCNISWSMIQGKPEFSSTAYSGSNTYASLCNAPSFCNIATSGSWNDINGKPTFATIATTGAWSDISGKPTALSAFTNDLTYLTQQFTFCNNIGIKNSSPAYELDVNGTINATAILVNGASLSQSIGNSTYWQTAGPYQYSTSNIGIGTSTPAYPLHVSSSNSTSNAAIQAHFSSASTSSTVIGLENTSSNGHSWKMFTTGSSNTTYGAGSFVVFDNTASSARLVVKSNGFVGIGTSNPVQALDVNGAINATSYCNLTYGMISGAPSLSALAYSGSNTYANITGTPNLSSLAYFGSNTWSNLSGKPTFAQVAYDGAWSNLQGTKPGLSAFNNNISSFSQTVTFNSNIQMPNTTDNKKMVLYNTQSNSHQYYGFGVNPNVLRYQVDAVASDHVFYAATSSNASTELLRVKGSGLVGFGTSSPSSKLHIANGNILVDSSLNPTMLLSTSDSNSGIPQLLFQKPNGDGYSVYNYTASNSLSIEKTTSGVSSSKIWVSSNIGIKNTNPLYDLDVSGTVNATTYCNIQWSQINNKPSSVTSPFSGSYTDLTNKPTSLSQFTNDISNFANNVSFNSNVGIGVITPTATLDVTGGSIKCSTMSVSSGNLALSALTSSSGTLSLGSDNSTTILNIGCPSIATNTINIATSSPASTINIGSSGDTVNMTSSTLNLATSSLSTTSPLLTLNSGGALNSGGSCGFQIYESSNATAYIKVSADRTSFLFKTPLGNEMSMNLTNNAVNINNNSLYVSNGAVGIGTNSPTQALEVSGSIRCASVLTTSDATLKTNICKVHNSLDKLHEIEGVYFDWKEKSGKTNVGVLAQQVQKVLPEAVSTSTSGMSVDYQSLIALLINAVNEQQTIINDLRVAVGV